MDTLKTAPDKRAFCPAQLSSAFVSFRLAFVGRKRGTAGVILVLVRNEDVYYNFIYDVPEIENKLSGGYTVVFPQEITERSVFLHRTERGKDRTV